MGGAESLGLLHLPLLVVRRDGGTIGPTSQAYRGTVGAEMDGERVQPLLIQKSRKRYP